MHSGGHGGIGWDHRWCTKIIHLVFTPTASGVHEEVTCPVTRNCHCSCILFMLLGSVPSCRNGSSLVPDKSHLLRIHFT